MNAWIKNIESQTDHERTRCNVRKSHVHDRDDLTDDLTSKIQSIDSKIRDLQRERQHLSADLEILTSDQAKFGNKHQVVDWYRTLHRKNDLYEQMHGGHLSPNWYWCAGFHYIEERLLKVGYRILDLREWLNHGDNLFTAIARSLEYDKQIKAVKRTLNKIEQEMKVMFTSQRGSFYNKTENYTRLRELRKQKIA